MKKLTYLSSLTLSLTLAVLLMACQKQQDAAVPANSSSDEAVIKNVAGSGSLSGKISREEAVEMFKAYLEKNNAPGHTEYVAFSIKDLQQYLSDLQTKYKADQVYVNIGVYDEATAPKKEYVGRTTIFFSGNNNKKASNGSIVLHDLMSLDESDFLNHGNIYP